MASISCRHVKKVYPGNVVAVPDFSLEIADKEFVVFVGPSGCGKSTTLRMIAGLEEISGGEMYIGDRLINDVPPKDRDIAMVFQNYALYPHMTVYKNMAFGLELRKMPKDEIDKRVREAAKILEIEHLLDRKPKALSGGQRQRVALGRAMVRNPAVFLLDEPLSNLDARLRLQTREEICKIQKKTGITTLFVTHDQEEAMSISDRIVVMKDGLLMQEGAPQQVYDDPANLFVAKFLGTPPINVFEGEVRGGRLLLAGQDVLPVPGAPDGSVWCGIRPEGFTPDPAGPVVCGLSRVEVLGRDVSIVCTHPACTADTLRAIVNARSDVTSADGTVRFALHPDKVFLFDRSTETRIRFGTQG